MRRVVILGCSGAGKSTFANALGQRTGLPVIHLDALFWQPGWKEPEPGAIAGDAWITDGNYVSRTYDLRLPRADMVIFVHQPRWLCIFRILWRWLSNFGGARPDLAPGCPENFDWPFFLWTWRFERQSQPRIIAEAERYPTPVTHLYGDVGMAKFLEQA
jgi:adenylate kinase family enzyme